MMTCPPAMRRYASGDASGRGRSLLALSAVAFSTAGFFAREAPVDLWAMIVWRNLFGGGALLLALTATGLSRGRLSLPVGRRQWGVVASASLGTVFYLAAFKSTSVADISIIYAGAPLVTAGLAWACLGEALSRRTLAASGLALLGVGVTVTGSVHGGTWFGDGLALAMTLSLSVMAVLARGSDLPALSAALASSLLTAAAVLTLGWLGGTGVAVTMRDAGWLAAFGAVTIAVAMPCYLWGATNVPAGKAMLISALEMPLAPLWVWLAFGETVPEASLIGGGIVAVAVLSELA